MMEGRSLIRTFLASATKDTAIISRATDDVSKLLTFENTQINLVFCSLIRNFAPDDES